MNKKISNLAQIAYARRYTINGGREDGLKVIEVNTGKLRFMLNESKALDIMQMWHEGTNLSFVSKNGFTKREIPFLKRFEGGMMYTCGFDDIGGNTGGDLHGSFHNIPANVIECSCDRTQIKIVADIEDTALFGKNLVMRRTVTARVLDSEVQIVDELLNRGTKAEDYAILYHINLGYPMLDKGVTIDCDAQEIIPRGDYAKEVMANRAVFGENVDNLPEVCYFIKNKTPKITVRNKELNKTFTLTYSGETLPCMVQWNSMASQDYALGTEVATTYLGEYFKYNSIAPEQKIIFKLNMKIC